MFNIGPTELIVVLVIALIVFGPKRLPEIGRSVGKSLKEFRRASQDIRDELHLGLDDDEPSVPAAANGSESAPPSVPPASLQAPSQNPEDPGSSQAAS